MNLSRMRNKGFTLIELMMGLTIMAVVGTVMLKSMSGLQDQSRYNQTVERVNQIKQAIVNVQTINGVPVVTGFVADMGRLPYCLEELLDGTCPANTKWLTDIAGSVIGNCITSGTSSQITYSNCTSPTPAGKWSPQPLSPQPILTTSTISLNTGWNGPYIQTSNDPTTNYAFSDGWGDSTINPPASTAPINFTNNGTNYSITKGNANNYGWVYQPDLTSGQLILQSFGSDGAVGTSTNTDSFQNDYPSQSAQPVINAQNTPYIINPSITVNLKAADVGYILEPASTSSNYQGICDITGSTFDPSSGKCVVSTDMCAILNNQKSATTGDTSALASDTSGGWTGPNCHLAPTSNLCTQLNGTWSQLTVGAPYTCTLPLISSSPLSQALCTAGGMQWDYTATPHSCHLPPTFDQDLCALWSLNYQTGQGCQLPALATAYTRANCPGTLNIPAVGNCTMGPFSTSPVTQLAAVAGLSNVTTTTPSCSTSLAGVTSCAFTFPISSPSQYLCSGKTWSTGNAYCSVTGASPTAGIGTASPPLQSFCSYGGGTWNATSNTCFMPSMDFITCNKVGGNTSSGAGTCTLTAGSTSLDDTCSALNGTPTTLGNGTTDACTLSTASTSTIDVGNICNAFSGAESGSGYPWNTNSSPYQCTFSAPYTSYLNTLCGTYLPATSSACKAADNICLNVFYRYASTTGVDIAVASWPGTTAHNNLQQTVLFTGTPYTYNLTESTITPSLISSPPPIPAGQNAISITSDSNGDGCRSSAWNNPTYPAGHAAPIPQIFIPGVPLVFNW